MTLLDALQVKHNPFVGPRAFRTGEPLYGRDREVAVLTDLLIAERIVLLYSPSGAGKTSLLAAGVVPRLAREGFRVLPTIRVGREPPPEALNESVNRYVLSTLLSLEEGLPAEGHHAIDELSAMSVEQYLDRYPQDENVPDGDVLIFDQFEELLTLDPTDQAAKAAFFAEVGAALRQRRRWAVFAIREDFLAGVDPYLHAMPTRLRTRYRLDLLDLDAARQAILCPPAAAGLTFSDAAARRLIDDLRRVRVHRGDRVVEELGPHVEPVQLQVVCRRLWQQLPAGTTAVDERDVDRGQDLDRALADYYDETVTAVAAETGASERWIRDLFDRRLITEHGFRGQVLPAAGAVGQAEHRVLELLELAHLVRGETRRGAIHYELSHDRMINPIRSSNAVWLERNLSLVQRQAALWESEHRSPGLLLTDGALEEAEAWVQEHPNDLTEIESDFLGACRHARVQAERQQRQAHRIRRLAVAAAGISIVAVVCFVVALGSFALARAQERIAKARWFIAEAQHNVGQDANLAIPLAIEALSRATEIDERPPLLGRLLRRRDNMVPAARSVLYEAVHTKKSVRAIAPVTPVRQAAFSPDGARLVTVDASPGKSARVWDHRNGAQLVELIGHDDLVQRAAFSPDGRLVATASRDRTAKLWDAGTGDLLRTFTGHRKGLSDVVFSPDGTQLATASYDGTAKIFDARTGRVVHTTPVSGRRAPDRVVNAVAFSPDGTQLATANADSIGRLWDVETGALRRTLPGHSQPLQDVAFNPDGTLLATASADFTAELWDVETGRRLNITLRRHRNPIDAVAFSRDGARLATAGRDGWVSVWEASSGTIVQGVREPRSGEALTVDFHPDGQILAAWKDAAPTITRIDHHRGPISSVAISHDGTRLATASLDKTVKVWDARTGEELRILKGHERRVNAVAFDREGTRLATGSDDFTARVWDVATAKQLYPPLDGHGSHRVNAVAFSPDGARLATAGDDSNVKVWDVATGQALRTLKGESLGRPEGPGTSHLDRVNSIAFSPDGTRLATASDDYTTRLWDVGTGKQLDMWAPHGNNKVNAVAFSPDGSWIATAGSDFNIKLWDADTRQEVVTLRGHAEEVQSVVFHPSERWIATAGQNRSVRVWDYVTGQLVVALSYPSSMRGAVFSPGEPTLLATGGDDAWLHVSTLAYGRESRGLIALARSRITANLTEAECRLYFDQGLCPRA
jgi:WD40 repeat protein